MAKYKHETLADYYERRPEAKSVGLPANISVPTHLNVFYLEGRYAQGAYRRRNFYVVALILNKSSVHLNDIWYNIDQPSLIFSTPATSYEWLAHMNERKAWICVFTEGILYEHQHKESLVYTSLTQFHANPVFPLSNDQCQEAIMIFERMKAEVNGDYALKPELLSNYLSILFHIANKHSSARLDRQAHTAPSRLTDSFLDSLNRQFPIETPMQNVKLKSAADFACHLSVHVNHLNRAIMETTGKTTTELIAERLLVEAISMLRHSQLTIAQIAYGLGFKEVAYFHRFFRKRQGLSPGQFRRQL
jgi:AraC-like DNA-binding protein